MNNFLSELSYSQDQEVYQAIENEHNRQIEKLELIASENIVSPQILAMNSSLFNSRNEVPYNKEQDTIIQVEKIAIERAKELFSAEHANVRLYSGSQANMAVYFAVLNHQDKVMGMDLAHGGHLTHGSPVNFSGFLFQVSSYGVSKDDERIDYDALHKKALEIKPKIIIAGASAYPRIIDFSKFREICDEVGAYFFVDMAHIAGLVATGIHPSPLPYADFVTTTTHKTLRGPRGGLILCKKKYAEKIDAAVNSIQDDTFTQFIASKAIAFQEAMKPQFKHYMEMVVKNAVTLANSLQEKGYHITTGGTDNHVMLLDLRKTDITGKQAEKSLDLCNITVNKNTVPFETRSPFVTSGIRLGSPALTTRGGKQKDFQRVAYFIDKVLSNIDNEDTLITIKQEIQQFSCSFPEFSDEWV